MADLLEDSLRHLLGIEGDFSDDPSDSGGATRYGVTAVVARANGYQGDMRELPWEVAKDIYRQEYWHKLNLNQVAACYPKVAAEMFEAGVNVGVKTVGVWLQKALNGLNLRGALYNDLPTTGFVGPMTMEALRAFKRQRGEEGGRVLLALMNSQQGAFYLDLALRREKDEKFLYGWILQRVV